MFKTKINVEENSDIYRNIMKAGTIIILPLYFKFNKLDYLIDTHIKYYTHNL